MAPNASNIQLNFNVENIKAFKNCEKLKKATLNFMASQLQEHEIGNLKDVFLKLDVNQDGTLTMDELREGISQLDPKFAGGI